MSDLFHYTCDHGRHGIGDMGYLRSVASLTGRRDLPDLARWIWLTDLDIPVRDALGLTSHLLGCDRTAHRYRVADTPHMVEPWTKVRRLAAPADREALESSPGARPRHWFVTRFPIAVVYDPIETRAVS
jgi:hypothetical protein